MLGTWLNFETYSFDKYIDFIEHNFESIFEIIEERFHELQATLDDDPVRDTIENNSSYYDHLMDDTIDDHHEHGIFQQRYRYSVIIQLFIFFETEMARVLRYNKEVASKRISGDFLDQAKEALKPKVLIATFPQYVFLKNFLELRNVIVHYNGKVRTSDPKISKKISCLKELKKSKGFTLIETENPNSTSFEVKIVDQEFLKYSLKQIEDFLNNLYLELKKS